MKHYYLILQKISEAFYKKENSTTNNTLKLSFGIGVWERLASKLPFKYFEI